MLLHAHLVTFFPVFCRILNLVIWLSMVLKTSTTCQQIGCSSSIISNLSKMTLEISRMQCQIGKPKLISRWATDKHLILSTSQLKSKRQHRFTPSTVLAPDTLPFFWPRICSFPDLYIFSHQASNKHHARRGTTTTKQVKPQTNLWLPNILERNVHYLAHSLQLLHLEQRSVWNTFFISTV